MKINIKSYTLRDSNGGWLGQVVLTSDGMFSAVTDYGNMAFAWRSFGSSDFREFISGLEISYFSQKMFLSNSDIWSDSQGRKACNRFSEMILPPLQFILKRESELGIGWNEQIEVAA